jgi:hypothetical protein
VAAPQIARKREKVIIGDPKRRPANPMETAAIKHGAQAVPVLSSWRDITHLAVSFLSINKDFVPTGRRLIDSFDSINLTNNCKQRQSNVEF